MKRVMAPSARPLVAAFAGNRTLVALDFDGTLSPIRASPMTAFMRPRTARLLADVAHRYPCAVITGRTRRDVALRVHRAAVDIVGNHGAEPGHLDPRLRRVLVRAKRGIARLITRWPDVWIEDKMHSLAVHYRGTPGRGAVRERLRQVLRDTAGVRVVPGKQVVNVVLRDAPHKGSAVQRLCHSRGCHSVIYVGDDDTDEDVFRVRSLPLLGIRIGRSRRSHAQFYLENQRQIDEFLAMLVRLRPLSAGGRDSMARAQTEAGLGATLEFMRLLWALDHALRKRSKRMASESGVTGPQRLALRVIHHAQDLSAGALAQTLKIHPSTLTGILQRLERRRLITRQIDRSDRRRQHLVLTRHGRQATASRSGSIEQAVARVLQRSNARDLSIARRLLLSLIKAIDVNAA
jgi:trehalose 6-phosphate phosphatase